MYQNKTVITNLFYRPHVITLTLNFFQHIDSIVTRSTDQVGGKKNKGLGIEPIGRA